MHIDFGFWILDFGFEDQALGRGPQLGQSKIKNQKLKMRRAFSFAEVMFAVIILGIGFIMISAIFPVALQQTKATTDETAAAALARAGTNYVDTVAVFNSFQKNMPSQTQVLAIPSLFAANTVATNNLQDALASTWRALRGNVISPDDPRYAWVTLYYRPRDSSGNAVPYAQLILICVQSQNKPVFTSADVNPDATQTTLRANLQAKPVSVTLSTGVNGSPGTVIFQASVTDPWPDAINAVAEGTYVVIRNKANGVQATDPNFNNALNGTIYRVAGRRFDLDSPSPVQQGWELDPGNDFNPPGAGQSNNPIVSADEAWIVGRGLNNPNDWMQGFEGPAMDISAYSTFVYVKP